MSERQYTEEQKEIYEKINNFMSHAPSLDLLGASGLAHYDDYGFDDKDEVRKITESLFEKHFNEISEVLNKKINSKLCSKVAQLLDNIIVEADAIKKNSRSHSSSAFTKIVPKILAHDDMIDFFDYDLINIQLVNQAICNIAKKKPIIGSAFADFYLVGRSRENVAWSYDISPKTFDRWRKEGIIELLDSSMQQKILSKCV